jgi:hypothetical protein
VCSNNTVVVAADSFTKFILLAMDLAVPGLSLEGLDSLTGFIDQRFSILGKIIIFIGHTRKVKKIIIFVKFSTTGSL